AKIAELVSDRKLEGIADLRDESDRNGMRIVIELKREAKVFTVLNNLYKHTTMQTTFGVIMLAIVDGRPVVLSLKQALQLYIEHRRNVIVRRTRFDLERAQERAHILEGLKICLDHLDEVIKTIRAAADQDVAATQLQSKFGLSERQPTAGSDAPSGTREEDYALHLLTTHTHASMLFFTQSGRVFQLRVHEVPERERQAKGMPINNLIDIGSNERITAVFVRPETDSEAHYMLMVTKNGYIKKTAMAEYANVRRNGLIAINLQEHDELDWVTPTSGSDEVIIATELGKAI